MEDRTSVLNSLLTKYEELIISEIKDNLESKINTKLTQTDTDISTKLTEMLDRINTKLIDVENTLKTEIVAILNTKLSEFENTLNFKFSEKTSAMVTDLNYRFADLNRQNHTLEKERNKLETIRLAQLTLVENSRSLPVEQREITAQKIQEFADSLHNYITKE